MSNINRYEKQCEDVLNFEIETIQVEDSYIRFRKFPTPEFDNTEYDNEEPDRRGAYVEEDIWNEVCENEDNDDLDFQINHDGTFSIEINIPKFLHGSLIGIKGAVKQKLESDTKGKITVPQKSEPGPIVITGNTPNIVVKCYHRIEMILMDARFKHDFTHFLSIPMNGEYIQRKFLEFKKSVLGLGNIRGIDETIFQNQFKLHITIGTLVLGNEEVTHVARILAQLKENILKKLLNEIGPLKIHMKGLEYMNDDPAEVDVLYAEVQLESKSNEDSDLLQKISDELIDYLADEGLTFKKYDRVKLHVTVMNTLFRKDRDGTKYNMENEYDKKYRRERETFDATTILEKFKNWDFGTQDFNEIHISIRKSTAKNNYYKNDYILSF